MHLPLQINLNQLKLVLLKTKLKCWNFLVVCDIYYITPKKIILTCVQEINLAFNTESCFPADTTPLKLAFYSR